MAYTQTRNIPPMKDISASAYEMQVRHPQELTDTSFETVDDDWELEANSRSRTPDNRYSPGRAL